LNISAELLETIKTEVSISTQKIEEMYQSFLTSSKEKPSETYNIKSVEHLSDILIKTGLLESCMMKWNGNDPQTNKNWKAFKEDKTFLELLFRSLFDAFDLDNDKCISFTELCIGINYLLNGNQDDITRMRFRSVDTDRNGYIDFKEATKLSSRTMAVIRAGFMIGLNQQKYELMRAGLSESDFIPLVDAIDQAFRSNQYDEKNTKLLFKYADKDQNGKITEDEYVEFMNDTNAQAERDRESSLVLEPVLADMQVNVKLAMLKILAKIAK